MGTVATVVLDDIDITGFCVDGNVTRRLNGVGTAQVRVNMREAANMLVWGTDYPGPGSYLKIYLENDVLGTSPVLWHHGRVMLCETTADENGGYTVFNSSDPLEMWQWRPVRDPPDITPPGQIPAPCDTTPGNFATPQLLDQFGDPADNPGVNGAPRVVQAMIEGSEGNTIPTDSEGPLRLNKLGFAAGLAGQSVKGAPRDWPMTMAEMASNLTATGLCDIVVTPREFDAFLNYGDIAVFAGDYGNDLTGDVTFSYGMGAFNVRALRWNEDMSQVTNKLQYFLGPKCNECQWNANITGDDPFLVYPPGGETQPPAVFVPSFNPLGIMRGTSQELYDVRMDIKVFDSFAGTGDGTDCAETAIIAHDMLRWTWQNESWIRAFPRNLIHVTPARDTEIGSFDFGDLVLVEAAQEVKGGFSGGQRVYQYTISWSAADSVPAISELQVSSDQEGFLT